MPEGHTIHRLARDLNRTLAGDACACLVAAGPLRRWRCPASTGSRSCGRARGASTCSATSAPARSCHVHLGLIGKFRPKPVPAPEPVGMIRLRLEGAARHLGPVGPDPVRADHPRRRCDGSPHGSAPIPCDATPTSLQRGRSSPARPARSARTCLDQSVIAGIGNVYRAELLFLCGIHPARPASSLSDDEFDELWARTVRAPADRGAPRSHRDDRPRRDRTAPFTDAAPMTVSTCTTGSTADGAAPSWTCSSWAAGRSGAARPVSPAEPARPVPCAGCEGARPADPGAARRRSPRWTTTSTPWPPPGPGAALRPHVKAFKCTALARHVAARGGHRSFCCATLREMEGMAAAGLGDDLLLANETLDADRLRALVGRRGDARITVAVDSRRDACASPRPAPAPRC